MLFQSPTHESDELRAVAPGGTEHVGPMLLKQMSCTLEHAFAADCRPSTLLALLKLCARRMNRPIMAMLLQLSFVYRGGIDATGCNRAKSETLTITALEGLC